MHLPERLHESLNDLNYYRAHFSTRDTEASSRSSITRKRYA